MKNEKKNSPLFVFFGTPRFATQVLDALEMQDLLPALIVTAPDKPQGRGLKLTQSPVKQWALARGIDVITPANLKEIPRELLNTEWDVFLVAAYAKLIPRNILELPKRGCLNVHPSLLPRFRGPSPTHSAILSDERATGVTIMLMDERMDEGDIVAQAKVELEESAWPPKGSLFEDLLATEGGKLLAETLPLWLKDDITSEKQNSTNATYTKKFTDEDSLIDPYGNAREQLLKIRTFDKNPRAHFFKNGKRILVTEAEIQNGELKILKIIPEGKKEITYSN